MLQDFFSCCPEIGSGAVELQGTSAAGSHTAFVVGLDTGRRLGRTATGAYLELLVEVERTASVPRTVEHLLPATGFVLYA